MLVENTQVISNSPLANDYWMLTLKAPQIAPQARPGQFVHLRIPNYNQAVLRRPFSIFKAEDSAVALLYHCIGPGTRLMTHLQAGAAVSLLGPLGNGFPPIRPETTPVLIGGGYGLAALYMLAQRAPHGGDIFIGGGCATDILCVTECQQLGWQVHIATEDGSQGSKGLVTDVLDAWLSQVQAKDALEFFACGPMGMLQAIAQRAQAGGWKAWLSLDQLIGCGLGACLACVQKVKTRPPAGHLKQTPASQPDWQWARVCLDGPVFESRDIVWNGNES